MIYQDINFKICLSLFGWKEICCPKSTLQCTLQNDNISPFWHILVDGVRTSKKEQTFGSEAAATFVIPPTPRSQNQKF